MLWHSDLVSLYGSGAGKERMSTEILEIVVLLEEFPDGLILGDNTRMHTIVWFKKNSDQYEFINENKPYILKKR